MHSLITFQTIRLLKNAFLKLNTTGTARIENTMKSEMSLQKENENEEGREVWCRGTIGDGCTSWHMHLLK